MRKRNRGTPKNISGPGNVVNRTANRLDDTPERVVIQNGLSRRPNLRSSRPDLLSPTPDGGSRRPSHRSFRHDVGSARRNRRSSTPEVGSGRPVRPSSRRDGGSERPRVRSSRGSIGSEEGEPGAHWAGVAYGEAAAVSRELRRRCRRFHGPRWIVRRLWAIKVGGAQWEKGQ